MKHIVLDFSEVKSWWELHEYFKTVFDLPDYYGRNMDALWDCLYCCYNKNTTIYIKNCAAIPAELQSEVEIMKELFQELHEKDGVVILYEESGNAEIEEYLI
jgi:ribonuclease inhibitor